MARPELVPHDAFYIKELNELINLEMDYDFWRRKTQLAVRSHVPALSMNRSGIFSSRIRK